MAGKATRVFLAAAFVGGIGSAVFAAGGGSIIMADPSKHFDPKGKTPSK
jgi:alkyl sulfatase BDS1-like metallo-beta-lactamase superfamily hydrolase